MRRVWFLWIGVVAVVAATPGSAVSQWSGANGRIALGTSNGIITVNPDGSDPIALTDGGGFPSWSPDGTKLAYWQGNLKVISADGSVLASPGTYGSELSPPSWSPEGDRIVYSNGLSIWITCAGSEGCGAGPVILQEPECGWTYITWYCRFAIASHHPAWSPNSETIAFVRTRELPQLAEIWLIESDGGNLRRLYAAPTAYPVGISELEWSPDGEHLSFWSEEREQTVDLAGNSGGDHPGERGRWAPDGVGSISISRANPPLGELSFVLISPAGRRQLTSAATSLTSASWQRLPAPSTEVPEAGFAWTFVVLVAAAGATAMFELTRASKSKRSM